MDVASTSLQRRSGSCRAVRHRGAGVAAERGQRAEDRAVTRDPARARTEHRGDGEAGTGVHKRLGVSRRRGSAKKRSRSSPEPLDAPERGVRRGVRGDGRGAARGGPSSDSWRWWGRFQLKHGMLEKRQSVARWRERKRWVEVGAICSRCCRRVGELAQRPREAIASRGRFASCIARQGVRPLWGLTPSADSRPLRGCTSAGRRPPRSP